MVSKAVQSAMNDQITAEFYAAYLYLSMAAYFDEANFPGFANWMRSQNQEEILHAMKLFDFMIDNGGHIELGTIEQPPSSFESSLAAMKATLRHEQHVTRAINSLYELALKEKDYPAQVVLQWFIAEQTEEEKTVSDIIARLELAGDNPSALLMIDSQLASRAAEKRG